MSHEGERERLLEFAVERLNRGEHGQAIHLLQRVLTLDPDDAEAHAFLAFGLVQARRLHAAEIEAQLALTLDGELAVAYRALGFILTAKRKWHEAEPHLKHSIELQPEEPAAYRALASLYSLSGRDNEAVESLQQARQLSPNDPATLGDLAEIYLQRGELMLAEKFAREALEVSSDHPDALLVMGHLALRRGDTGQAREHAVWVLRDRPTSRGALVLLSAVKARESIFLGLWWRWNTWMQEIGTTRSVLVLLAGFALYRTASILLDGSPNETLLPIVQLFWYGVVIYTWVAPMLHNRALEKELENVRLKPF